MLLYTMLSVWNEEHARCEVMGHGGMLLERISIKEKKKGTNARDWGRWCVFVSDTQSHPPQTNKHEHMLLHSTPADTNTWTWTTGPEPLPSSLLFAQLSVPRSVLQRLLPLPQRQRQRDKQNLELTQNESSACTKAILILLNSSAWSTGPSPLINSGSSLQSLYVADTVNIWGVCTVHRPRMHALRPWVLI